DAATLQLLGELFTGTRRGATVNGLRDEMRDARTIGRVVRGPGMKTRIDRHRGGGPGLLREHRQPVGQHPPCRRETAIHRGSNRPITRLAGASRSAATFATSSTVTASRRDAMAGKYCQVAIVSKNPSWCAMFDTLSCSKTSRARSCRRAFCSSAGVMPVVLTLSK